MLLVVRGLISTWGVIDVCFCVEEQEDQQTVEEMEKIIR